VVINGANEIHRHRLRSPEDRHFPRPFDRKQARHSDPKLWLKGWSVAN
jgi:hypothetical protein